MKWKGDKHVKWSNGGRTRGICSGIIGVAGCGKCLSPYRIDSEDKLFCSLCCGLDNAEVSYYITMDLRKCCIGCNKDVGSTRDNFGQCTICVDRKEGELSPQNLIEVERIDPFGILRCTGCNGSVFNPDKNIPSESSKLAAREILQPQ